MALLNINNASLSFGEHILFNDVTFGVELGEKIALIGRNGSGKSSLFKAIQGIQELDQGNITISTGKKIIVVNQEPSFLDTTTIFNEIFSGLGDIETDVKKYYYILDEISETNSSELLDQLDTIQNKLEHIDFWNLKNNIDKMLSELNLNKNTLIGNLSGGMKKKVAIIKALIANPDILLLDEPTNHLDISSILWLEKIISEFKGSVIIITHDRYFLDKTVSKIIELDRGKINIYPGSFAKYKEIKEFQLSFETKMNKEFDKFLAQEEVWIRKGVEARRTRNEGRVKRLKELREERARRSEKLGVINLSIDASKLSGNVIASLDNINLSFNNKVILENFSAKFCRGDKIGLVGPNGVGKSTLLKVILNQQKVNSGKVDIGTKLEVAYFDQFRDQLNDDDIIADVINQGQEYVEINGKKVHITRYLESFLFVPERFRANVGSLSGGEKNRLLLARLFSKPANVIILDEPTNDLDIETLDLLEETLINYTGTVFLVSHDRSFLDNIATQLLVFEGDGKIVEIVGGYSDYLLYTQRRQLLDNKKIVEKPIKTNEYKNSNTLPTKLSYKDKLELDALPREIEILETKQLSYRNILSDSNIYKEDLNYIKKIKCDLDLVELEIQEKLDKWEKLENLKNSFDNLKK